MMSRLIRMNKAHEENTSFWPASGSSKVASQSLAVRWVRYKEGIVHTIVGIGILGFSLCSHSIVSTIHACEDLG